METRLVITENETVAIESRWVRRIDSAYVFWNMANGTSKIAGLRRYEDKKCFMRLFDWAPTTPVWFKQFYGETPSRKNPRPDLRWAAGTTRPQRVDANKVRESRWLDDALHYQPKDSWTEEEISKINHYRVHNPVPTEIYQPWPVAVALLEQPYVPFANEAERKAYQADMQKWEKRIKEAKTDGTSVRAR